MRAFRLRNRRLANLVCFCRTICVAIDIRERPSELVATKNFDALRQNFRVLITTVYIKFSAIWDSNDPGGRMVARRSFLRSLYRYRVRLPVSGVFCSSSSFCAFASDSFPVSFVFVRGFLSGIACESCGPGGAEKACEKTWKNSKTGKTGGFPIQYRIWFFRFS